MSLQHPVRFRRSWFIFTCLASHPPCWLVIFLGTSGCDLAQGVGNHCKEGNKLLEAGTADGGLSISHRHGEASPPSASAVEQ